MKLTEIQKTFTPDEVGKIIRKDIDNFGENAWYINNGWCWGFANKLVTQLGGDAKVVNSRQYKNGTYPGHSWVEYNDRHYDVESPDGVDDPSQMQYHRRMRAIADSPDDMDEREAVRLALGHDPVYYGKK